MRKSTCYGQLPRNFSPQPVQLSGCNLFEQVQEEVLCNCPVRIRHKQWRLISTKDLAKRRALHFHGRSSNPEICSPKCQCKVYCCNFVHGTRRDYRRIKGVDCQSCVIVMSTSKSCRSRSTLGTWYVRKLLTMLSCLDVVSNKQIQCYFVSIELGSHSWYHFGRKWIKLLTWCGFFFSR